MLRQDDAVFGCAEVPYNAHEIHQRHRRFDRIQTLIHYPGNAFCVHANTDSTDAAAAAAASNCNAHNNNNEDVIAAFAATMQCISRTIVR